MFNYPLFLKLIRDLWQRRLTLFVLILIIAIGIGSYIGMAGVYQDLDSACKEYFHAYRLADFTLDLKRAPETVLTTLKDLPNLQRLNPRIRTAVMVNLPRGYYSGLVKPIPGVALSLPVPQKPIINDVYLYTGRWFSSPTAAEVILDQQFAKAKQLKAGDRITVRLTDKEHELLVIGTAFSPEYVLLMPPGGVVAPEPGGYAVMYLPYRMLQQSSGLTDSFNQLLGIAKDNSATALQNTMRVLGDKLTMYGVLLETGFADQPAIKVLLDELQHVQKISKFFPTLFLLIAILILNITLSRLVTEQRSVIGTLKSLGYTNVAIFWHYLFYSVIIGLIGGVVGIGVGIGLQELMLIMYRLYFQIPGLDLHLYPMIFLLGVAVSTGSAILGSISGAHRATHLSPAEAMRPPMPERTGKIFLEHFSDFWQHCSFQRKMIFRTIFRNRFRSLVTIIAAVLAMGLVFSSLSFLDAIDKIIRFSFDETQKQDITITLRDPLGKDILRTITVLPGVRTLDTQLQVPAEIRYGSHSKRLEIIGLPRNNTLFVPIDLNGRPITIIGSGLVITENLAKTMQLKVGDRIYLKPLLGERKLVNTEIAGIVTSYVGLAAYANQEWLSRLLGNSWLANSILIKLLPHASRQVFVTAASKFAPMINITDKAESKKLLMKTIDQFMLFAMLFMIFFAAVIAIGAIINTALISLDERERDVACLRVLGFTNFQVARIFFGESWALNLLGLFFGMFFGVLLAYLLSLMHTTEVMQIPTVIRPLRILEAAAIMLAFVSFSQMIIFWVIRRINWFTILNNRE